MDLKKIASIRNLDLAWRRITAFGGIQYKSYFRDLYFAYQVNLKENLKDLCERIRGGTYNPVLPARVYIPKSSGLQRPITLLHVEDQIIYQAIANLFAEKIRVRRRAIEYKHVFSNILLPEKNSIFFIESWKRTYPIFHKHIRKHFFSGNTWVAHFDLAAFYDTISHELLLNTTFPRSINPEFKSIILGWFKTWSTDANGSSHGHGLPQGPLASDFLAECLLLPIDKALSEDIPYLRYVDDIRILGKNESDVRKTVVKLEQYCRNRGLIPQGNKFSIQKAETAQDAQGILPSIPEMDFELDDEFKNIPAPRAIPLFKAATNGEDKKIVDKSRARFVLFRAQPSTELLNVVLPFSKRHPEHIDAFIIHFKKYGPEQSIFDTCLQLLDESPYDYVHGELWGYLAHTFPLENGRDLVQRAIGTIRKSSAQFSSKLGALKFLFQAEAYGFGNLTKFIMYLKSPLLQAVLVPQLPDSAIRDPEISGALLKRTSFEPALLIAEKMGLIGIAPSELGIQEEALHSQVRNHLLSTGILVGKRKAIDPIGEILAKRYKIERWDGWRKLLGKKYQHSLSILLQADPVYHSGRSRWICNQNSFNQCVFLSMQEILVKKGLPGVVPVKDRKGDMQFFGVTLDLTNSFSKQYPIISFAFRNMNSRRNRIPDAHAFHKKGGGKNSYLDKKEQEELTKELSLAYSQVISEFKTLI